MTNNMNNMYYKCLIILGRTLAYLWPPIIGRALRSIRDKIYTGYLSRGFAHFGHSVIMWHHYTLRGRQFIKIGNGTIFERDLQLTALQSGDTQPHIIIGDHCLFRRGAHITAINSIRIGNNLLTGTNVLITDNAHGNTDYETLKTSPRTRVNIGRGEVNIGDNVWIGNNVCILPGVSIGDGVVIGANSIVTHDIPAYSIAAGIPAKVIKETKSTSLP